MDSIGKYRVVKELGKGATATVYLCVSPDSDRPVAVKLIRFGNDSAAMSRRLRKLFKNEEMVAGRLAHPNIAQVYEGVVEDDYAYLAMEYIDGFSLENHTRIDSLLPLHRVIAIVFRCCMALDHAYRQGIVHRDIKPANILITGDDEPKILDFGLALNLSKDVDRDTTFIMGVGSPSYMSPEQVKGYPLNQKTDLYSLGVVLFQLLTGRLPFRARNQATLIYRIINTEVPDVTALNPGLPEKLNGILHRALEKDLYNRYRNGAELAKDLAAVRYQMLDEDTGVDDTKHFEMLRRLPFFTEFENVELWEILRISVLRPVAAKVAIIREGESNRVFGFLIEGFVEVSIAGRSLCRLAAGEPIGEVAYLYPGSDERSATVVTLEESLFLEVSASALALASEELQERMRGALIARLIDRMREVNRIAASLGAPAVDSAGGYGGPPARGKGSPLELAPVEPRASRA